MKAILFFLLLFPSSLLFSQASVKGNWNEVEKQYLIEELNTARENFETFLDSAQVDVLIECLADNIEAEFENMDEMDGNSNDIERMTFGCLEEMGLLSAEEVEGAHSEKGNWSAIDRNLAYQNLEHTRSVMNGVVDAAQVDALFDCIVDKMEMNYSSLVEASNDGENLSQLTSACIRELELFEDVSSSTKGNWNALDKAALEEQLEYLRPDLQTNYGTEDTERVFDCIREKFQDSFENYQEINNRPEIYRSILDECYGILKK